MADSGAILRTLIPFPLHSEVTPPSLTIPLNPDHRLIPRAVEPCTCKHNQLHTIITFAIFLKCNLNTSVHDQVVLHMLLSLGINGDCWIL